MDYPLRPRKVRICTDTKKVKPICVLLFGGVIHNHGSPRHVVKGLEAEALVIHMCGLPFAAAESKNMHRHKESKTDLSFTFWLCFVIEDRMSVSCQEENILCTK